MTFTKGPWTSINGTTTGRAVVALNEPKVRRNVCMVGGQNRDYNARLIAAAPDMLEALKLVAASPMRNAAYDACIEAIAKAEGRE